MYGGLDSLTRTVPRQPLTTPVNFRLDQSPGIVICVINAGAAGGRSSPNLLRKRRD
jgi:hypothetical protein